MIYFRKLKFKNFLSYGNNYTEYIFKKGITRITGLNGAGKSSLIIDPLFFALYGKSYRKINLNQLINSINKKNLEVILEFQIDNINYEIRRGLSPNFFEIYKNGSIINISSHKKNYQEILENEILHLNEDLFHQSIVKSLSKEMSFLSFPKNKKREIIELLFGIEIFSYIKHIILEKISTINKEMDILKETNKNNVLIIEREKKKIKDMIEYNKKIEEENRKLHENNIFKINELKSENEKRLEYLKKIDKYRKKYQLEKEKLTEKTNLIKHLEKELYQLEGLINSYEEKINLFNTYCMNCSNIENIKKSLNIDNIKSQINSLKFEYDNVMKEIELINENIDKYYSIIIKENNLKKLIEKDNELIKHFSEMKYKDLLPIDTSTYDEYIKIYKNTENEYNKLNMVLNDLQILKKIFSDDGLKIYIIEKYLPVINKILNTYLQYFQSHVLFEFDNELNLVIKSKFKENFSYYNFSEGQKRRIDLSIMFTFLEFIKYKNKKSSSNLLILDEINTGLDIQGENTLYDVLYELVEKNNLEIIVISQTPNIDPDKFTRIINVSTNKNFSYIN